jgi:hypothetical protein
MVVLSVGWDIEIILTCVGRLPWWGSCVGRLPPW